MFAGLHALWGYAWTLVRIYWRIVLIAFAIAIGMGVLTLGAGTFGASAALVSTLGIIWAFFAQVFLLVVVPLAALIFLGFTLLGGQRGWAYYTSLGVIAAGIFASVFPLNENPGMIPRLVIVLTALVLIAVRKGKGNVFERIVTVSATILLIAYILALVFPSTGALASSGRDLGDNTAKVVNRVVKGVAKELGELADPNTQTAPPEQEKEYVIGGVLPVCRGAEDIDLEAEGIDILELTLTSEHCWTGKIVGDTTKLIDIDNKVPVGIIFENGFEYANVQPEDIVSATIPIFRLRGKGLVVINQVPKATSPSD